jgi:hypothetical protein
VTDSAYFTQLQRQRDDALRQLQAAERELGARRTCEALALAVLNGWGVAGSEADLMRHEVRQALLLADEVHLGTRPEPVHESQVWEVDGEWNVSCQACPESVDNIGGEDDAEEWAARHKAKS